MLKESLENFVIPNYGKTQRSPTTYQTVAGYCTKNLVRLLEEYYLVENDQQLLREMRYDIDGNIRRYHKYCIHERAGVCAHYREVGSYKDCDFEHLIPEKIVRDLLLAKRITITQALNSPTVLLSRTKHAMLKDAGWAAHTPDMWLPFRRYSLVFESQFITYDGTAIDPDTWTLEQHYHYFKHLVI